jgi:hypothetical protein
MGTLRRRIGDAFVVKEAERLARSAARTAPVVGRRRGPGRAAAMAPVVVVAGLVATAGLLLWDERRRAAMRRRLEEVAGTVGSGIAAARGTGSDRVAPPRVVEAPRD